MTTETPPDWVLLEAALIKARELAIENMRPGLVVERAIRNGAYDKGTMITKWIPVVLANREEAIEE